MANSANPSNLPPSEWYLVSVPTVCLLDSCPQNLVFAHYARQFDPCRLWGSFPPPEPPRIPLRLHSIRPGVSIRTPLRQPAESLPWRSRPVDLSTPNCRHLVCANSSTSITADSSVPPAQLAYHTTRYLRPRTKTMGFHPIRKYLLRLEWLPRCQHEGCTPEAFYGSRLQR